jgi:NAD(P)-dependent dehydrogenase (short-subunit alcohol dehydrogenase family)
MAKKMNIIKYSIRIILILSVLRLFMKILMLECKNFSIENQSEKLIIVTGGNSGLGYETVKQLSSSDAHLILASRNIKKGEEAKKLILLDNKHAKIDVMELDLSSFDSVKQFSNDFIAKYETFDVLVNNAGIMAIPEREVTKDNLEMQIGTNHFGHFLLTSLLFPVMKKNGRVINVSSGAHKFQAKEFPFKDIQSVDYYEAWTAYGNSKASNLYFTYELNRRLQNSNRSDIISIATHPGYTATNLQTGRFPFFEQLNSLLAMSPSDGAQSQILAAVGNDIVASNNDFIGPRYLMFGPPSLTTTGKFNIAAQNQLWLESIKITGANFLI